MQTVQDLDEVCTTVSNQFQDMKTMLTRKKREVKTKDATINRSTKQRELEEKVLAEKNNELSKTMEQLVKEKEMVKNITQQLVLLKRNNESLSTQLEKTKTELTKETKTKESLFTQLENTESERTKEKKANESLSRQLKSTQTALTNEQTTNQNLSKEIATVRESYKNDSDALKNIRLQWKDLIDGQNTSQEKMRNLELGYEKERLTCKETKQKLKVDIGKLEAKIAEAEQNCENKLSEQTTTLRNEAANAEKKAVDARLNRYQEEITTEIVNFVRGFARKNANITKDILTDLEDTEIERLFKIRQQTDSDLKNDIMKIIEMKKDSKDRSDQKQSLKRKDGTAPSDDAEEKDLYIDKRLRKYQDLIANEFKDLFEKLVGNGHSDIQNVLLSGIRNTEIERLLAKLLNE